MAPEAWRKSRISVIFKSGDAFGETSLVMSKPRGGTVICIREKAEVLRLNKSDFNNILRQMSDKIDFQSSSLMFMQVTSWEHEFHWFLLQT